MSSDASTVAAVNWGVLSTARIGVGKVIPGMQRSPLCRFAAIASRAAGPAQEAAASLGIPRAYGSYEELLADPDIDAIYNPLPNHLHVPWTIKAMDAGKHVLCEKPIALTAAEAEQLLDARARTGKLVAEAFMIRHTPWWQRARALVRDGSLGEIRAIQTFFSYFLSDPADIRNQADIGGGGLMDIGCYAIASARFLLGEEPSRVAALIERDPQSQIDRLTSALLAFPSAHLTFTCSTSAAPTQRMVIVGTRARVEILIPFNAPDDVECEMRIDDGHDLSGAGAVVERFAPVDQYTLQGEAFSRAVLGQAPLEFPIEDAVQNMRIIEAIFAAGSEGSWRTV
jgi:predicted dehydrogenase